MWGLAKHKLCPRHTSPDARHCSFCPFHLCLQSTAQNQVKVVPKSKTQLPLQPDKTSQFHGKRTEKSAKEIRVFYWVGKENFRSPAPAHHTQTPFWKRFTETWEG